MKYIEYPKYELIDKHELKPMSIILVAGKNWFTKTFENKVNKYPYKPAFTHALIHVENGLCCNVGFTTTIDKIDDVIKKSHYYLSIELKDLTTEQIMLGKSICYQKAGSKSSKFKIYDVLGFLAFGLRKLGIKAKGSKKLDFCSDQVVDTFALMNQGMFLSVDSEKTSPCGIYLLMKDYPHAIIKEIQK